MNYTDKDELIGDLTHRAEVAEAEVEQLKAVVAQEINRYSSLVRHAGEIKSTNMDLKSEVERLKKRVESQTDWYQQRFDTLRVWLNNEVKPLSEEVAHRYFSICANGSPAPHEEGEWKDTLHGLRLKRDAFKAEVERLKAHTWEQERESAVSWLRTGCYTAAAGRIERGEHWSEGGEG